MEFAAARYQECISSWRYEEEVYMKQPPGFENSQLLTIYAN
jgi:hypothetical protein